MIFYNISVLFEMPNICSLMKYCVDLIPHKKPQTQQYFATIQYMYMYNTVHFSTLHYSTVHYSTVHYMIYYSTVH